MTRIFIAIGMVAAGLATRARTQSAGNEVIALEKGALDRWGNGDVEGYLSLYADEITYFDPFQAHRIDGLAAMRAAYGPFQGKIHVDRYEMLNPKVQLSGDIAVLSYNIQNYASQPDGSEKTAARWNVTEVFRRTGDKWRTIHSHFSFTQPKLAP